MPTKLLPVKQISTSLKMYGKAQPLVILTY